MSTNQEYLKELKCSGCGQSITNFDKNSDTVVCPFCKKEFLNPFKQQLQNAAAGGAVTSGNSNEPNLIYPFQTNVEDFSDQIITNLITTNDVPLDIFQQLSFDRIERLYVPYFSYQGSYYSSWNCEVPRKVGSGQDQRTEYYPHSGFTNGNFRVLCPAWANTPGSDENSLPSELTRFIENDDVMKEFKEINGSLFESSMVQDSSNPDDPKFRVMKINKDARSTWNNEGQRVVERIAENKAGDQAPSGKRNLRCSTSVELDQSYRDRSESVLVPFWYTQYSYGDQQFFFVSSGVNKNLKDWTHPIDDAMHKRGNLFMFGMIALVIIALAIIIFADSNSKLYAIIPAVIGVVAAVINSRINSSNKAQRIAAARAEYGDLDILNRL